MKLQSSLYKAAFLLTIYNDVKYFILSHHYLQFKIKKMKKFFQKIGAWIHWLLGGVKKFTQFVEDHVDDAIAIAGNIRDFVNSPTLVALESILPANWQAKTDETKQKVLDALSKTIDDLGISKKCLALPTLDEKIQCFVAKLKERTALDLNGTIQKLATGMVLNTAGNDLKENVVDNIVVARLAEQNNTEQIEAAHLTAQQNADAEIDDDQ